MKKLLVLLAVAGVSAGAYAADAGKSTDFKFGGSISEAFNWNNNITFQSTGAIQEENWLQKTQFHVSAMTSDKMMAYVNMLHSALWGSAGYNGTSAAYGAGTSPGSIGTPNGSTIPQISEAWVWWKATDSMSFRTGRQSSTWGNGFVISRNDGLPYPYFYDALMARMSWDFGDLDFGGAKVAEAGVTSALPGNTTDTEVNFYGVNFGFKSMPDMIKKLDIFALQAVGDTGTGGAAAPQIALPGLSALGGSWGLLTAGFDAKLDMMMLDLEANFSYQTGKQKGVGAGSDVTYTGMAYDLQVGVNFPEFMKGRVYVGYHSDTGNDSSTDPTQNHGYQPLFYDVSKYSVAGIWGMGNLTDISFGASVAPSEESSFGLDIDMASRTTDKAPASVIPAQYGNTFNPAANGTGTDKALATTAGLWANHNYGHGFNIKAGVNYIMLGNYYKPTGVSNGSGIGATANATYNF